MTCLPCQLAASKPALPRFAAACSCMPPCSRRAPAPPPPWHPSPRPPPTPCCGRFRRGSPRQEVRHQAGTSAVCCAPRLPVAAMPSMHPLAHALCTKAIASAARSTRACIIAVAPPLPACTMPPTLNEARPSPTAHCLPPAARHSCSSAGPQGRSHRMRRRFAAGSPGALTVVHLWQHTLGSRSTQLQQPRGSSTLLSTLPAPKPDSPHLPPLLPPTHRADHPSHHLTPPPSYRTARYRAPPPQPPQIQAYRSINEVPPHRELRIFIDGSAEAVLLPLYGVMVSAGKFCN